MASTLQPSQAGWAASNARLQADGGSIFADVPNAVTSVVVIVHRVNIIETLRRYGSPDNHELRAGRAVVLRLPYWRILCRPEASRSSLASVGTTGARTGRSGAFKLANAGSRIGVALWPEAVLQPVPDTHKTYGKAVRLPLVLVRRENDREYGNGDENSNCSGGRGRINRR